MLPTRMFVAAGALLVSVLAVPSPASAGRMIERDFHAEYAGVYQTEVTHQCALGEQANLVLGEGVGSLIGRFDVRIEACVRPTGETTGDVSGTAVYTAANGDLLTFGFAGEYVVNLDTFTVEAVLPATSASGTGRFAHVELGTAGGAAYDFNPLGSGLSYGFVDGSIVYDASDRADH